MVYVINKLGQPLMPTENYRKVRILLSQRKAIVVRREPFTIQLTTKSTNYRQPITLGVDAGSKTIGLSASTEQRELYAAEVKPRNDIVDLLSSRRQFRCARRNRTTRYRAPRLNNRVKSKNKGWLAPSVETKIEEHISAILRVSKLLPLTKVVVETAEFDTQRLKAMLQGKPLPVGTDYQLGEQYDTYNVRQYVLHRDGYICRYCKHERKLHVHHLESRKTGGNRPDNLITLCEHCHKLYHKGAISLDKIKVKPKPMRDAAFMGIMRKTTMQRLRSRLPSFIVLEETSGYITKYTRKTNLLVKSHVVDAICIAGHPKAIPATESYLEVPKRRHNRQLHKATILKGGIRRRNQSPKYLFGFQLFDRINVGKTEGFIWGRRATGSFGIRQLNGTKLSAGISYKKLNLLEKRKSILIERQVRGVSSND